MNPRLVRGALLAIAMLATVIPSAAAENEPGFVEMFNGRDLTGWQTSGNWVVEEGNIITLKPREGESGWKRFDDYLTTERKYGDFILDLEFKFDQGGNSGVFMRIGDLKDHVNSGFEVQILDTHGKKKLGHHDCGGLIKTQAPSKNMVKPAGEWNRYTITLKGSHLSVVLNGEAIIDLDLSQSAMKDRPATGHISFQDEAKRIWYRNVRIKELNRAASKKQFPVSKPNILVIFADDLDFEEVAELAPFGDAALAGQAPARNQLPLTPNLDRLVQESLVFTQFHVASTVCTPSRYCLLTGQYASRSASLQRRHPVTGPACVEFNTQILPGQWHLARGMKAAGYTTGIVGKWHNADKVDGAYVIRPPIADYQGKLNGPQDPLLPENLRRVQTAYRHALVHLCRELGWDYASSIYMGNANELGLPKPLWETEHNMEWFTAGALRFLDERKNDSKPFFLYFAPNIPHGGSRRFLDADPRATPEGLVDWHLGVQPSRADVLQRVKAAGVNPGLAWATWLDDGVGAILKKIGELGMATNTVVLFSSDQQTRGKWTCYQGARVPLTVRWPGNTKPGGRNDVLLNSIDFTPTLLELAGAQPPSAGEAIVDGRSFAAALTGGTIVERPVLVEMGYGRAIISGGWKYIACRYPDAVEAKAKQIAQPPDFLGRFRDKGPDKKTWPSFGRRDQLFNLRDDPLEQHDLAADPECGAKLSDLRALLERALAPLPHVFGEFKPMPSPGHELRTFK